jgi:putative ABC transport system permease protein
VRIAKLALEAFLRDLRSGELAVLIAALVVAVGSLTAVGFYTSRIGAAMRAQAGELLAADLRLEAGHVLDADGSYAREAKAEGLALASSVSFPTVLYGPAAAGLSTVRAVSEAYPLRGTLKITDEPFAPGHATRALPGPGEAWADSRLLARLGLARGAELNVGAAHVRLSEVLAYRPDQGSGFAELAPTLLMAAADLPATRLVEPRSRATWALLFAGPPQAVARYRTWLLAHRGAGERLIEVGEASKEVQSALARAEHFLNLATLVAVVLAAVAVAMTARRYAEARYDAVAVLKCLGAARRTVLLVFLGELLLVALLAAGAGSLLGLGAQSLLAAIAAGLVQGQLPPPAAVPALLGLLTATLILLGFALPPLVELARTPPARVLRRELAPAPIARTVVAALACAALLASLFLLARDVQLVGGVAAGALVGGLVLYATGRGLVALTRTVRSGELAWRHGLLNVARRGRQSAVQVVAFGLGLSVLLLLAVVRTDLMEDWQASLPADAPDHFLVNIPPEEVAPLVALLAEHGVARPTLYPWVRARLLAVNGRPVSEQRPASERARAFLEREQNLSWSAELPPDNTVISGRWWEGEPPKTPEVSLAKEFADELGLKPGDELSFDVAGERVIARVASVRRVRWDGFKPNFFLMFSPGALDASTGTYMTSVHLGQGDKALLAELARRFPSVSVFDVGAILAQIRSVTDRAALAVEYVSLFSLLAGVVVLIAAVEVTRSERRYESAVLRALGASRRRVLLGVATEFVTLGLLAGVLAAAIAALAEYLLATRLFGLHYRFVPALWAIGVGAGVALVGLSGTYAARGVIRAPPAATLKETLA